MHKTAAIRMNTPMIHPRINPTFLCFFREGGERRTSPPCECAFCGEAVAVEAAGGVAKKGEGRHGLLITSPQRLGFHKNEDIVNLLRVGVTGTGPVRLLLETLKIARADWFNGGIEPLNRLELSRRQLSRSRTVNSVGSGPERLLWERSRIKIR